MEADVDLSKLAKKLRLIQQEGRATQVEISELTDVDQATISRVMNGKRRRTTDAIHRLDKYVNMITGDVEVSEEIRDAARDFLSRGGSEAELISSIRHLANLISRRLP